MDIAGASRTLHAVDRLLATALLAALLASMLAPGAARAQLQAPPDTAPGASEPGEHAADARDGEDRAGGQPHGDGHPPGGPGGGAGVRPHAPAVGAAPQDHARAGGDDGRRALQEEELAPVGSTYVAGKVARMRTDGRAAIPRGAPKRARSLIAQYNRIAGKRYKWGGGHARLVDSGYDCSGAVGYGLIRGGLLHTTIVSGDFARWGAAGAGRWVTIFSHRSHVYIEVAGLRLDTSAVGDRGGRSGVRWRPAIGRRRGFKARHPVGL